MGGAQRLQKRPICHLILKLLTKEEEERWKLEHSISAHYETAAH